MANMRRSLWILILVVLAVPAVCFAWGGEGHQLIALIAEDQLTPQAKAAVKELLDGAQISDAEVASWADQIRRERRETAPWHYVNIPHDAQGFDRERDGRGGDNIIDALERQAKILADKAAPREQRQEALKWVVHLVGDLHQPLHCADRNGDKGGNSQLVFYPGRGKAVSLHFTWDTLVLRDLIGRRRIADVAAALGNTITSQQRQQWGQGTPATWANEAHHVAVEKVYKGVPAGEVPKLGRPYLDAARKASVEQIKRAGVRLAMVLNDSLGDAPP